jgi:hypothetical protein
MPTFYLRKKKCECCNREYSGMPIGHGEKDSPFIFRQHPNIDIEAVTCFWMNRLVDPEMELVDQWLQKQDKDQFVKDWDINKNKPLIDVYYDQETIKTNDQGYMYSPRELILK